MRSKVEVVLGVEQNAAPRRYVRWKPEAEEGQRGLGDDRRGDVDGSGHDDRAHRVGQDVANHLSDWRSAQAARRLHEFLLAQRQELGADEAGDRHPAQAADHRHDQDEDAGLRPERLAERVAEEIDDQEQEG